MTNRDQTRSDTTPNLLPGVKDRGPEAAEVNALPNEAGRIISPSGCAVSRQRAKPLALDGTLDSALAIAEKRRDVLVRLRSALQANDVAALKAAAKELCGVDDEEESDRTYSGQHTRTSQQR